MGLHDSIERFAQEMGWVVKYACLLYTSDAADD